MHANLSPHSKPIREAHFEQLDYERPSRLCGGRHLRSGGAPPPPFFGACYRKGFLMAFSLKRLGFAGLTGVLVLAAGQALAQQAQPDQSQGAAPQVQGPIKLDLVGTKSKWTKVCGHDQAANKDVCYTTRDFSTP